MQIFAREITMRRREFIVGLGAAAWPIVARAAANTGDYSGAA